MVILSCVTFLPDERYGRKQSSHNLRCYPSICLEGLRKVTRKTSDRIADHRVEIWTQDFPKKTQYLRDDYDFRYVRVMLWLQKNLTHRHDLPIARSYCERSECNVVCHRSHRCGSRTRGPSGVGTWWGRRADSKQWLLAVRTAAPAGDPPRWAQHPWSWGTATACRLRMRFTITTTTTPKPHRPSASETCTSHPDHRAERDTVPIDTPQTHTRNIGRGGPYSVHKKVCDSGCLNGTTRL
jgi:hypothetical protein